MWVLGNLGVQTVALVVTDVRTSPHDPTNTRAEGCLQSVPVLLLAMQSGSQLALVRHDELVGSEKKKR